MAKARPDWAWHNFSSGDTEFFLDIPHRTLNMSWLFSSIYSRRLPHISTMVPGVLSFARIAKTTHHVSVFGWIYIFQLSVKIISSSFYWSIWVTCEWFKLSLGEMIWAKKLEFISASNGAWRLYRWGIHLVWKHLFTIALKWRLHWNCFKCFLFEHFPRWISQKFNRTPLPSFQNLPTFDWTELFCGLLSIWTQCQWSIWVTCEWFWLVVAR